MSVALREGTLEELAVLHAQVPELLPGDGVAEYRERVGHNRFLMLVAEIDQNPAGFKFGYWTSDHSFYSWVGGVLPGFRRLGIARQLLEEQERRLHAERVTELRVKSMNRYPGMMILLIGSGYDIEGVEGQGDERKILFVKNLQARMR